MSQAPFIFLSDHSNISIAFVTSVHVHVHLDKFPAKMQKFAFILQKKVLHSIVMLDHVQEQTL